MVNRCVFSPAFGRRKDTGEATLWEGLRKRSKSEYLPVQFRYCPVSCIPQCTVDAAGARFWLFRFFREIGNGLLCICLFSAHSNGIPLECVFAERKGKREMKTRKLTALIIAMAAALSAVSCSSENASVTDTTVSVTESVSQTETESAETSETEASTEETAEAPSENAKTVKDLEGGTIEIKNELNAIISGAPSVTEILTGLGIGDRIIAADMYSADVEGIDPAVCTLDFYNLDIEYIASLEPDAVIIDGISMTGADDPYSSLKEAGVTVLYVPSAASIDSLKDSIRFISECVDKSDKGTELIADIDSCISEISEKAAGITEKKSVYFEISAAPYLYSCGNNTFINDILNIVGAENIYANEEGWISNSEETVIAADPDVIITSVKYDGYDFNEISARAGWENISAVKNGQVYQVEPNPVSRPSQNVVKGIREVAAAVYPEIFGE